MPASVTDQDNVLGMSDSEIANINPADLVDDTAESNDQDPEQDADTTDDAAQAAAEGGESEDDTESGSDETAESDDPDADTGTDDEDDSEDSEASEEAAEDDSDADEEPGEAESEGDEDAEDSTDDDEIDYKAEYEKLMAPFRANGKEIKAKSPEEVRQLMQMGANYNKKMAAMKPNLKLMKMLEKEELLDEEKLSHLVDLKKGNPQAIQKLLKESGIDPMDFEEGKESDYKPGTYTVDDREVELDTVLDEIQDTPAYSKTINVVSNKWDTASRQTIADNPQVLKIINDHMEQGIFDQISKEVERERTFGRLNGVSDIEAYKQVGDAIEARGGFTSQSGSQSQQGTNSRTEKKTVAKKTLSSGKKADDPKLKEKKRAAGSTKSSGGSSKGDSDFNPLSMPDEEIAKMVNESLM